jgi:FkbM family methyltransferase
MRIFPNLKKNRFFWKVKLFLKRLIGRELWLKKETVLSTLIRGDWEYCPDYIDKNSIIYSLGVGDSIVFDNELILAHGCQVHAFDPTPFSVNWISNKSTSSKLLFHPWAVSDLDGKMRMIQRENKKGKKSDVMWTEISPHSNYNNSIEVPVFSVPSIMKKLNHTSINLIKIDIEGTEYQVIDHMIENGIFPQQILVEYHHRFKHKDKKMTQSSLTNLRNKGYKIFSISETGREIGLIRIN